MHLSVVIPHLEDHAALGATLARVRSEHDGEIVVVDGGSETPPLEATLEFGARLLPGPRGRAVQMNAGAAAATGDTLLFLHADTRLPEGFLPEIERVLALPRTACGAFRFRLDQRTPTLRFVERAVHWRCRLLGLPYGDQGLFLRRATWDAVGGYPELASMEDLVLARRLRRIGRVRISPLAAITSARQWQKCGVWRTAAINQLCIAAFYCRVSPERLARWRAC